MGKWTRRGFVAAGVAGGGALLLGVAVRPGHRAPRLQALVAGGDEILVNAWLKIAPDNRVTAIVPHAEMGQGAHSALAQMLADELDADWRLVSVQEAPAHEEYANYALGKGFLLGDVNVPAVLVDTVDGGLLKITQALDLQITGGSLSLRATGTHAMRVAGAATRQMLAQAAAAVWNVPAEELTLRLSRIAHAASGKEAPYADFAVAAAAVKPPAKPRLKAPDEFTLMGRSAPRKDIPAKVDGSARFGIDAVVPGEAATKVAVVRACPVFGGTVDRFEDAPALAIRGVERVVNLGDAVAVVADGYWPASQGLAALEVRWRTGGREHISQDAIFAAFARDAERVEREGGGNAELDIGDVEASLAGAARRLEAEYRVPYLAHAAMEPLACTAWVRGGLCDIWTGTQNPLGLRAAVAETLGVDAALVTVHNAYLGGAFGRRATFECALQAVRVAKVSGGRVQLIWSREEDIAQDKYRPACVSRFRGGLNGDGRPAAWWNVYTNKHDPAEAPLIPYAVAHQRIEHVASPTHVPFGVWRSVDHSQHAFFTESFIDEMAAAAGADPVAFRRALLAGAPRHKRVLDAAAKAAGWGAPLPAGKGRGVALHESFGTVVAQVAQVAVSGGKVRVEKMTCAVDAGFAVNPDGLIAQLEGGIVFGLSAALHGEISIAEGRVAQSNFHDYPVLRMDEMPAIETVIVNGGGPLGGGGEPGTPPAAPALTNAVFAATGVRVRELPLAKHDLAATRT